MKRVFFYLQIVMIVLALGLCNGCSSSDDDNSSGGKEFTLTGVAAKGPVKGGTISVYTITATGQKGELLGTTTTSTDDGSYSLAISYSGAILIEITGGTYTDEATGASQNLATPLRAAVGNFSGSISVAVTPLTELAVSQAEDGGLSEAAINSANAMLSLMLGEGGNILTTQPVDVNNEAASSGASDAQLEYSLLLAAFSQYAQTKGNTIKEILDMLKDDIKDNRKLDTTAGDLLSAMTEFISNNKNNHSGVHNVPEKLIAAVEEVENNGFAPNNAITGSWIMDAMYDADADIWNSDDGEEQGVLTFSGTIFSYTRTTVCSQLGNYSLANNNTLIMSSYGECLTPPDGNPFSYSFSVDNSYLIISGEFSNRSGEFKARLIRHNEPSISGLIYYTGNMASEDSNHQISVSLYSDTDTAMEGDPDYIIVGSLNNYTYLSPQFGFNFFVAPGRYQLLVQLDSNGDNVWDGDNTTVYQIYDDISEFNGSSQIIEITSSSDHRFVDIELDDSFLK